MQVINGIPAAGGTAIGPGFHHQPVHFVPPHAQTSDVGAELERLESALQQSERELQEIYEKAREGMGEDAAAIFQAHLMMLRDPDLLDGVQQTIQREQVTAEVAFYQSAERYAQL